MMTPVPMAKVGIVGPKARLPETVETLHRMRLLHIEDFADPDEHFQLGSPLPEGSRIAERLLRLRGVMKGAEINAPDRAPSFTTENLRALEEKLREVEDELAHLVEERNRRRDSLKKLDEDAALFARIQNFPLPTQYLGGYSLVATATGFVAPEADLAILRKVHPDLDYAESQEAEGMFLGVFVPKSAESALNEALAKLNFQALEVPAAPLPPRGEMQAIAQRRQEIEDEIAGLNSKIAAITESHAAALFALDEHLSIEADKTTAPVRFRTTANSFMIEGWIPHDQYARLEQNLQVATRQSVYVTRLQKAAHKAPAHGGAGHGDAHEAGPAEEPPVLMRNPNAAGPYELLTDTYSRPKYSEVDPTLFMYVGFPLFYGIMLGDIGYGLVLVVLVLGGVFNKLYQLFGFQSRWHLNRIFLHASISSVLFGLVYGEFFGLELYGPHSFLEHSVPALAEFHPTVAGVELPLNRFENVKLLLAICLAIAVVHLFLGLLVGIRNATRAHGPWEAIKHRGSWLGILLGFGLMGAATVPSILGLGGVANPKPLLYAGGAVFLLGWILLFVGEGAMAIFEWLTVVSNLLSYTRLVAIGLSGAGIAFAGNEVSKLGFDMGGVVGVLVGILILAVFHLLNLALGVIGPALHSLRLHYVEFFTKFYEGGGAPYEPFGAQRKYTTQEVKQA